MNWTQAQRDAAFNVVYSDLRAAAGFWSFLITREKVYRIVDGVLNEPTAPKAYLAARALVNAEGYGSQVSDEQIRTEVDKAWFAASAA